MDRPAGVQLRTYLTGLVAFISSWRTELSPVDPQIGLMISAVLLIVVVAVTARFGDRLGPERVVLASGIWIAVWAVPSYALVDLQNPVALWVSMAVGFVAYGAFGGVAPRLVSELFSVEFRYLGVGAVVATGGVIVGALLPIPALACVGATGGSSFPLMVMVAGLATVAGAILLRRDRGRQELTGHGEGLSSS